MDPVSIQVSVENFCRVFSILGLGKMSPEILRKAKHKILDDNETKIVKNILSNLCRNVICNHDCLRVNEIDAQDLFSWFTTIVSKFNCINASTLKTMLAYDKNAKNRCLKLENSNLFLKDFSGSQNDKSAHLIYYYNLKIKSFELSYFEEVVSREKKSRDPKLKLQKAFKNWKESELVFWKWVKLEKRALHVLPSISKTSPICEICQVDLLPHFLLLNNQYLLFIKQSSDPKAIFENILNE